MTIPPALLPIVAKLGEKLWDLLVEGREPDLITFAELRDGVAVDQLLMDAAEERARRRLGLPPEPPF